MSRAKNSVNLKTITEAYDRISTLLRSTPVQTSSYINELVGKNVFFKCENFQKTGSFKVRGALNKVLKNVSLEPNTNNQNGFVTYSCGNFGQGLAWACHVNKSPCTIVVPQGTPQNKINAIELYADVVLCESNPLIGLSLIDQISKEKNYTLARSSNDIDVICGQGTCAYEFLDQVKELDAIVVTVSGGGLIAGISAYAKSMNPSLKIIAVEPEGKRLAECLRKNERNLDNRPQRNLNSIAESINYELCCEKAFPIMVTFIEPDDVITVSDSEMIEATKMIFERMKLVIELAAGNITTNLLQTNSKNLFQLIRFNFKFKVLL